MAALIAVGCTRSGDVVVVIDSTMRAGSVEVVAVPGDPARSASADTRSRAQPADSASRLRSLDDSAATLDERFRGLREAVNTDVRSLDTVDRRTRTYATRYAEVRRRTLEAEQLRARRDSMQARADALRAMLDARAKSASRGPITTVAAARGAGGAPIERRAAPAGALTLSLAPGVWWIGVAPPGAEPTRYDSVIVGRGTSDTVYVGSRGMQRRPRGP